MSAATLEAPATIAPAINAETARREAGHVMHMEVSTQVRAGQPVLREGERPCWAVPVSLTFPHEGDVGRIGEVLVDAMTGEVLVDSETLARITANADDLARRTAP